MRDLEGLFELTIEHARETLLGKSDEQLQPTFWIQRNPGPGEMIVAPWNGEREKAMARAVMRLRLADPRAHSYAFACEAWVTTERLGKLSGLAPSEHPGRREVVLTEAFTRYGKGGTRFYAIKRNRKGVVTAIERDEAYDDVRGFQGRLHNLFRPAAEAENEDEPKPDGVVKRGKGAGVSSATRAPDNHCLDCGKAIDAGTPAPGSEDRPAPNAGDIAICLDCTHIMAYNADLTVRPLTDAEVIEIAGDREIVDLVNHITQFNKANPRGG